MEVKGDHAFPTPMTLFGYRNNGVWLKLTNRLFSLDFAFLVFVAMHDEDVIHQVCNLASALDIKLVWSTTFLFSFTNMVNEVDMRDGVLNGKNQRSIVECAACGRKVSGLHAACLYCGEVIDSSVFNPG